MNEQLLLILFSAITGGFIGTLISLFLPKLFFDPKINIMGIEKHGFVFRLIVVNKGRTCAENALGRIIIRPIKEGDIIGTREEIYAARKKKSPNDDWRKTKDAWLKADDWKLGIESEYCYWARQPNQAHQNLNPNLSERLIFAHSEGAWVNIASENPHTKRACLALDSSKIYYCEVVIGAANAMPSKPFRFQIKLGADNKAIVEPYKGKLPEKE